MNSPVLLALSSFRQTDEEIKHALDLAVERGVALTILFVVDVNLARYFAGSGVMVGTDLRHMMEEGILVEHEGWAREVLAHVCSQAAARGVECTKLFKVGRFAEEVKAVVAEQAPPVVVVTRARRPAWLRRLFGSPVDQLSDDIGEDCELVII